MRLDRKFWLRIGWILQPIGRPRAFGLTVNGVDRFWLWVTIVLALAVVLMFRWYGERSAAPLQHYNQVSRKLEDEQHTLDRMRTWRIASPSPNPLTQDADQRAEQRQRELVLGLVKERDALAQQLGNPVKPADD